MTFFRKLLRGENDVDFIRLWRYGLIASAVLVVVSIGSLFFRGLNLGIDFEGGTLWEVPAPGVSVPEARDVLEPLGQASAKVQIVGADTLRVQAETVDQAEQEAVRSALGELAGVDTAEVAFSTVGPTWGEEVTGLAVRALVVFILALLVYLSIRLEWEMALGTIIAMLHDVVVSVGIYSLFQWEVTPATVVAFLTILGYSIYDTIVVYDKVKENDGRVGLSGRMTYTEMLSLSMNQVLLRSINTTVAAVLPIISLLVVGAWWLGALTIQEFGVALLVGMLSGAYSSIFVAAPVVAVFKERQHKYRQIRERLEQSRAQGGGMPIEAVQGAAAAASATGGSAGVGVVPNMPSGVRAPRGAIPPRPRKQGKKR